MTSRDTSGDSSFDVADPYLQMPFNPDDYPIRETDRGESAGSVVEIALLRSELETSRIELERFRLATDKKLARLPILMAIWSIAIVAAITLIVSVAIG